MLGEEDKDRPALGSRKTYSRSVSWAGRSPANCSSRPHWNSKARACLPPLQPLSIARPKIEDWPKPGLDDLGVWTNPPTPGLRPGSITTKENLLLEQPPREFEFKKDKLAFFNKECSRIVDHIYLGSDTVAQNREVLRQNGITHVLNCVGFLCPEYFKNDLVYKTLWLQDSPSEDITSILYDVFDYFEDVREQGGRVFVHCCQGVSRSTSLVIAYLMWKEGQSFEDAFQHVKSARGVTNPNMGFACQLLQCQKRVHALPASPSSVLRMYRLAPHSPYDPLHVVPKLLSVPGPKGLDSRGAFIVQVPSALYVWIGKDCISFMSDTARAAAFQVIRYESAPGPVAIIREGEEPPEFWDALGKAGRVEIEEALTTGSYLAAVADYPSFGGRKVYDYDLDFEIFHKALSGGVVPPFSLSGSGSETCLPARENGWSKLRQKFASGIMKDFITLSKLSCDSAQTSHEVGTIQTFKEVECVISPTDPLSPSSPWCDSSDLFSSSALSSPSAMRDFRKEDEHCAHLTGPSLSRSPSFSSLDSFPSFNVLKHQPNTSSPSLSPSTSDYSGSFTFSPSSSDWSDLSYLSAQPSPSGLESKDLNPAKNPSLQLTASLPSEGPYPATEVTFSTTESLQGAKTSLPCRGWSPSLAERRGNNLPPMMMLPSMDDSSQANVNLLRSWSFSLPDLEDEMMTNVELKKHCRQGSIEMSREAAMLDANIFITGDEVQNGVQGEQFETSHLPPTDVQNRVADVTGLEVYQWPSMLKVNMAHAILDSGSVYMLFVRDENLDTNTAGVLYVWVGCDASIKRSKSTLISNSGTCEESCPHWETVGRNFINQNGLATSSQVQIVTEGEEPEQLLKHLPCFSFQKTLDRGVK